MGFYVRKGFNFGPLRVNFSKSGISKNMLRLSWPLLTILAIVIAGIYFYLQAGGDISVMKSLLWQQLTNWS